MSKARKEKVYPIGRLKILLNLIKGEEDSSQTRVLGVSLKNSPKTTNKNLILRITSKESFCLNNIIGR